MVERWDEFSSYFVHLVFSFANDCIVLCSCIELQQWITSSTGKSGKRTNDITTYWSGCNVWLGVKTSNWTNQFTVELRITTESRLKSWTTRVRLTTWQFYCHRCEYRVCVCVMCTVYKSLTVNGFEILMKEKKCRQTNRMNDEANKTNTGRETLLRNPKRFRLIVSKLHCELNTIFHITKTKRPWNKGVKIYLHFSGV